MKKLKLGWIAAFMSSMMLLSCVNNTDKKEGESTQEQTQEAPAATTTSTAPIKIGDPLKNLSMDQFKGVVTNDKLVLVDFYADWCGPCKALKPSIEQLAEEMKDKITVLTINVDDNQYLSTQLKIDAIPLLHIYKKGALVWQQMGLLPKEELKAALEKQL